MLPDRPLTTDDCATKIGAGLCRSHPSKTKWSAKEAVNMQPVVSKLQDRVV